MAVGQAELALLEGNLSQHLNCVCSNNEKPLAPSSLSPREYYLSILKGVLLVFLQGNTTCLSPRKYYMSISMGILHVYLQGSTTCAHGARWRVGGAAEQCKDCSRVKGA
jgi:hypothetical protein